MQLTHLVVAFVSITFSAGHATAGEALRNECNSTTPLSLNATAHEELAGVLKECKDPRSIASWNEILDAFKSNDADAHDKNKDDKTDVQAILQHLATLAGRSRGSKRQINILKQLKAARICRHFRFRPPASSGS
ncbi:uncharacterized protein IUM83_19729 [Phytophthora cinnamomi]|uniref:uncharacterized protein n=1 Tax=Phytophthora cinnamomi TaxID=4785 RepID=UPI003559D07E|nr:hypothetical protein IUM83_19729 [Phytophthora cinnamomi]